MKSVKEMAKEYYPQLWPLERLEALVKAGKLSREDMAEIVGGAGEARSGHG